MNNFGSDKVIFKDCEIHPSDQVTDRSRNSLNCINESKEEVPLKINEALLLYGEGNINNIRMCYEDVGFPRRHNWGR